MSLCDACRACEVACAAEHCDSDEDEIQLADLEVEPGSPSGVERGIRLHVSEAYAHFERCLHCTDAPCMSACPNGAMALDEELGVVYVDRARCQSCFMCAAVCPFGAISVHPITGTALKCDSCRERMLRGEQVACVAACEKGALRFIEDDDSARRKQREIARGLADVCGVAYQPAPSVAPVPQNPDPLRARLGRRLGNGRKLGGR
jgi:carbon-monoxide dehydrogenase iron sulfur subunit